MQSEEQDEETDQKADIYNKILHRLYLGNKDAAQNKEALDKIKCTHILQVTNSMDPYFPDDYKYKVFKVNDMD